MSESTLFQNATLLEIVSVSFRETCFSGFANNIGADQPAHPHSLISAFVIRFLESIISKLATNEILSFLLVSVAEETGLSLAFSETPKRITKPLRSSLYFFREN